MTVCGQKMVENNNHTKLMQWYTYYWCIHHCVLSPSSSIPRTQPVNSKNHATQISIFREKGIQTPPFYESSSLIQTELSSDLQGTGNIICIKLLRKRRFYFFNQFQHKQPSNTLFCKLLLFHAKWLKGNANV